ncbi:MAG: hypothetical protein VXX91_07505 [Planctomycetota bacterium]|nr:hypothetical protein [Planctomycetota bacterium]
MPTIMLKGGVDSGTLAAPTISLLPTVGEWWTGTTHAAPLFPGIRIEFMSRAATTDSLTTEQTRLTSISVQTQAGIRSRHGRELKPTTTS